MPSIRRISLAVVLAAALVASVVAAGPRVAGPVGDLYSRMEVLARMMEIIERHYVEDVTPDQLFRHAVDGVLAELDPHSRYYTSEEYRELTERYRGDYHGIGIQFEILDGYVTVLDAIEGGPSERLGLHPGDQIVAIDGEDAEGIDIETTYEKLRGPKGTDVIVTIRRPGGEELRDYTITRDQVEIAAIRAADMIDADTGYIWLQTFSQKTADQLEAALDDLERRGMKTLVLDLRHNTGGLMNQAIRVADKFLNGEKAIVLTKGRTPNANSESLSTDRDTHSRFPMIVLVNHQSASASEIVAGALQDWDRALIVGQRTFGKALVQNQFPFKDGSALFLTIARYYTPSGRLIQRDFEDEESYRNPDWETLAGAALPGQAPGEEEEVAEEEVASAPEFRTASGRIVYGGGGIAPDIRVEPTQYSRLAWYLFQRRLSFQFAMEYVADNAEHLPPTFEAFRSDYEVPEEVVDRFLAFLERPGVRSILDGDEVPLTDELIEESRPDLRIYLKADIAGNLWGQGASWLTLLENDEQVEEALGLKQRAADLLDLDERIAG